MTRRTAGAGTRRREGLDGIFACLANGDRRRLLGILFDRRPDSMTRRDLASQFAREENSLADDPDQEVRQASADLHHDHLPKLEAAGLIDRDVDRGTVAITDHLAFRDPGIVDAIGNEWEGDPESLDALFGALADGRRRTILDVLSHQFQPIHTETLAREVGADERDVAEHEVPATDVEAILVSLRHVHLPTLADAGLIEYDPDDRTVSYEGHPELRVPWMHSVLVPGFRASLTGESDPGELGTIEGREDVISYGQSLGERAEKELFCMFTHRDMLEAGCFARIMDASRRGVDVYLGTYDPTIRDYVRENVPDVVIWEPRTDWLNLPVEGNRVGRLLLADREAVMLGTLKEGPGDDLPEEKALIGEGTDNTLVVMIRQMLSNHLERIDEQAGDAEVKLPF